MTRTSYSLLGRLAIATLCGVLTTASNCYDEDDYKAPTKADEPTYLTLSTREGATSIPADGFSVLGIVARIAPEAVTVERTIRFQTDRGTLLAPGQTAGAMVQVAPDSRGEAVALLQSDQTVGPVTIVATVIDSMEATAIAERMALEFVDPRAGSVLRFVRAPSVLPADGATIARVTVTVAESVDRSAMVEFTTTAGGFSADGTESSAMAAIDASRQATALLYSASEITEGIVSATVTGHRVETRVRFERAGADEILVEVDPFRLEPDGMTNVTVRLVRDVGTPTEGTVVRFSAEDATGEPFGTFRNVGRSSDDGTATAVLHREETGADGRGRIVVTADASIAVGEADLELVAAADAGGGEGS